MSRSTIFYYLIFILASHEAVAHTCMLPTSHYSIKANTIVYSEIRGETTLASADATTFHAFSVPSQFSASCGPDEFYAVDKASVYYKADRISQADVASFQPLAYYEYATDRYSVFISGKPLKDADPRTFRVLAFPGSNGGGWNWSRLSADATHVWDEDRLTKLDATTFALFPDNSGSFYGKDKNGTYKNLSYAAIGVDADK